MTNRNKKIILSISILFGIFLFFNILKTFAGDCDDKCRSAYPSDENAKNKCENNCKDLEKKAEAYQKIIDIKNKQQDTLNNQLNYINNQKNQTQKTLNETTKNIESLSEKITSLENNIKEKEKNIIYQKKILSGLMQSYYDYDRQGILEIALIDKDFLNPFKQGDYLEQSEIKVSEILIEIKESQKKLLEEQKELQESHSQSEKLKNELESDKYELQLTENQKQGLLVKTKGEEQKYQDLLARVEQQKMELFDFSSASNLTEVSNSIKNYSTPDKKTSTSWYFSQKDSRWGNQRIGNSKSLMKDYGCAVSAVAMVFKKMGASIDPGKLAKEKIFYYDLIRWPSSWAPKINLSSSINHGNINWSTINSRVSKGDPVIIYIKKTNGRGGHYVVITGKDSKDYIVHDPYFGANIYLGTSKALVGKIGVDSKTTVDQMIIYK